MSGDSKLISVKEAAKLVPNGATIGLGGFAITRCTMAFGHELIRQGKTELRGAVGIATMDLDMMVGMGVVDRIVYGGGSLDAFGPVSQLNMAFCKGKVKAEEYSSLGMTFKFLAGSLGIPYIPIQSMLGSDLLRYLPDDAYRIQECPFTGEKLVQLRALVPDFGVVHVQKADEMGNTIIKGPMWENVEMARASKKLIVIAEDIVSEEYMQLDPNQVTIPAPFVDYVVHQPYGSYPCSVYECYDHDFEHLMHYCKVNRDDDAFRKYVEENVLGVDSFDEYLQRHLTVEKLMKLRPDPTLKY